MPLIDCAECGRKISDQAAACPGCGIPVSVPKSPTVLVSADKSRSLAILLAMLGGCIGLHKFYLNRPGPGVIYLLFCWTFIPMILGFFEGLSFLFMNDQAFEQHYLNGLKKQSQFKSPPALEISTNKTNLILECAIWLMVFLLIHGLLSTLTIDAGPAVFVLILPLALFLTLVTRWIYKKNT